MAVATRQMGDSEDSILQGLLVYFSKFNYDKAKEQAEKERDLSRFSGSTVWHSLLSCVAQLAAVEKLYMNLSFLTAKGFLRKESSVRASYESLNLELNDLGYERRRCMGANGNPPTSGSGNLGSPGCDGILRHLCSHLVLFIKARLQMITLYECDILIHLLRSQLEMQHWRFLPSLIHLHDAHSKLNSWHSAIQPKETKKYGFGSNFLKSSPLPALYQWLWQAKAAFVSKFSLYFHETLATQSSPAEMKALISRQGQACDYVSKIQSFQRKSDAVSVCLVFEAAGIDDYRGAGYHHPQESVSTPKGLDSYPAIFSYPNNKAQDRWPSIVMRINDRANELTLLDGVVCFFDQQVSHFITFNILEAQNHL
ncbi:UPF0536 protein C12orf66 [Portunus trituberculatus]|uniref:UPF0536 protein C12orf66 n=1 Tax=Portunus trituberculatus TaxID=210409 RepID=A0A5B7FXA4_PORTR|nr:UPF0536 protein C12orf66 [Portunus trituberculatus]